MITVVNMLINKGWYIRFANEEDIPLIIELNKICLPENYPEIFFRDLLGRYPKLFIVAEKNSGSIIKDDILALEVISILRAIERKDITVEELIKLKNQKYETAKETLERILEYSNNLPIPFRFFKKDFVNGLSKYQLINDPLIIGYIMCRLESGISSFKFKWVRKGHIVSIAVDEPFRKQGIGEALLSRALKEMEKENISEQVLEVRTTNYEAINIYQKFDFEIVKTLKRYYYDGADAYLMAKKNS
jgi:ribosomal protein S18 acetylase RimI-like enzyme